MHGRYLNFKRIIDKFSTEKCRNQKYLNLFPKFVVLDIAKVHLRILMKLRKFLMSTQYRIYLPVLCNIQYFV